MKIRLMNKDDIPFVTKSILMSYRAGCRHIRAINKDSYLRGHNQLILKLLSHESTETMILADDKDDSLILGFISYSKIGKANVLNYLYVRNDFRESGIASVLLKEWREKQILDPACLVMSHLTDNIKPARFKKLGFEKVYYDPYIIEALW